MKTMLTKAAFSKSLCIESQGPRLIAIGAMLVTAWLSTAPVLANGPKSQAFKSPTPESLSLRLRFDDGLLSLHANQRPFAEVLGAIQKATGIRLHYPLPLPGSITESFTALPIKRALERLFGPEASLMFRYPAGGGTPGPLVVPKEVWVIGKIRAGSSEDVTASAKETRTRPQAPIAAPEAPPNPAAAPAVTAEDPGMW
jgi:hypothetical protein